MLNICQAQNLMASFFVSRSSWSELCQARRETHKRKNGCRIADNLVTGMREVTLSKKTSLFPKATSLARDPELHSPTRLASVQFSSVQSLSRVRLFATP